LTAAPAPAPAVSLDNNDQVYPPAFLYGHACHFSANHPAPWYRGTEALSWVLSDVDEAEGAAGIFRLPCFTPTEYTAAWSTLSPRCFVSTAAVGRIITC
jgi:hypothetical protein